MYSIRPLVSLLLFLIFPTTPLPLHAQSIEHDLFPGSVVKEDGADDLDVLEVIRELEGEMQEAASKLEFERAALLRDQVNELKKQAGVKDHAKPENAKGRGRRKKVRY